MKKIPVNLILGLVSGLLLSSCATLKPEKPVESYSPANIALKSSFISIPMEIDIHDVENLLNREFTGLIYEDNSFEDNGKDNLMVKAWKKDNIRLGMENNVLSYKVPLKLWIKAGWKFEKFGISASDYKEIDAEIALRFKTALAILPNWTLGTTTTSEGYEWLSAPVIKVGPVNVPIKFIADLILKTNLKVINREIDEAIRQNFDMKKVVRQAWEEFQQPMKIDDQYNVWLRVSPQQIYTTPLQAKSGKIRYVVAVKAVTEAFIGQEPARSTAQALPDLIVQEKVEDIFQVNLMAELGFPEANKLAHDFLAGQVFSQGRYKLLVNDVKLYGTAGKMAVALDVAGSLKGKLYLAGTPYYESSSQSIRLKDLDFDIKTRNALVKSGSWLFEGHIVKMIEKKMVFPMADQLLSARGLIEQSIQDYELGKGIKLQGKLEELEIEDIVLSPEKINAGLVIRGRLGLLVK